MQQLPPQIRKEILSPAPITRLDWANQTRRWRYIGRRVTLEQAQRDGIEAPRFPLIIE